ncbi:MAG: Asp-tRNA(Asn)/Glu-tRNA(Gln) amidotransferase subunit GatC [Bacteroidota bacterium]
MQITDELLDKLATLSRLHLDPTQRGELKQDLQKMLDFVEQLRAVDTAGVAPLIHIHEGPTPMASDEPLPPLHPEDALKNAPEKKDTFFQVPKVVKK